MSKRHRLVIQQLNAERRTRKLIARDEGHPPGWWKHTDWDTNEPKDYIINLSAVAAIERQWFNAVLQHRGDPIMMPRKQYERFIAYVKSDACPVAVLGEPSYCGIRVKPER